MRALIVSRYTELLKRHFGVKSDDDLARRIGVGKSTLASWRMRGSIPPEIYKRLLADEGIDYFAFVQKHIAWTLADMPAGEKILLNATLALGQKLKRSEFNDWAGWLAENRLAVFERIVGSDSAHRVDERIEENYVASRLVSLAMSGATGELLSADDLLELRESPVARGTAHKT